MLAGHLCTLSLLVRSLKNVLWLAGLPLSLLSHVSPRSPTRHSCTQAEVAVVDKDGATPLALARKHGHAKLVSLLAPMEASDPERLWIIVMRVKRGCRDTAQPGGFYKASSTCTDKKIS